MQLHFLIVAAQSFCSIERIFWIISIDHSRYSNSHKNNHNHKQKRLKIFKMRFKNYFHSKQWPQAKTSTPQFNNYDIYKLAK